MPVDLVDLITGTLHGRGRPAPLPVAVVTMELQRGVMGDLASFPALRDAADEVGLVEHARCLLDVARLLEIPVCHLTAEFRPDRAGTAANTPLHAAVLRIPGHLVAETAAVEIIPELGPEGGDLVIPRRHGVSPFHGTALDITLRNLGVSTVIVTGVSVNLGVLGLCIEAVNVGYQVLVATDAVCGVPASYAQLVLAESIALIATLASTQEIIAALHDATEVSAGSV